MDIKKIMKKIINYFLGIGSFLLALLGMGLSLGLLWGFFYMIWQEYQKNPFTLEGTWVALIIIGIMFIVSWLIANIGNFLRYTKKKFK